MHPDLYHDLTSAIKLLTEEVRKAREEMRHCRANELEQKAHEIRIIVRELDEMELRDRIVKNLEKNIKTKGCYL